MRVVVASVIACLCLGIGCRPPIGLKSVSVGPGRACGVADDLVCWGGFDSWNDPAAAAPEDVDFRSISLGTLHACGLDGDGHVHCFGPASADVVDVPPELVAAELVAVAAGHDYTCGVRADDGSLACWGVNPVDPTCGLNPEEPCGGQLDPPTGAFVDVSLGDSFYGLCARAADGRATCWGGAINDTPATRFRAVGAGASHACGIVEDDSSIDCWGAGPEDPWAAPPAGRFTAVTAGFNHSCGIDDAGHAVCWGAGPAIADVADVVFVTIDAGSHQTCGITAEGTVHCWGLDSETRSSATDP